jgi:sulfur carrier protein ThiS
MQLHVKLFASMVRHVPAAQPGIPFDAEVPDGLTVEALLKRLGLPREEVRVVFINGRARPMEWVLQPNDEVGIFPAIGGG